MFLDIIENFGNCICFLTSFASSVLLTLPQLKQWECQGKHQLIHTEKNTANQSKRRGFFFVNLCNVKELFSLFFLSYEIIESHEKDKESKKNIHILFKR
ncbi:MAG: hypothetical protein SOT51_03935, partial [Candidatus Enterosoma sp.]|nr:hypothetical protein [Candidatus Enterosoma sp.]